MYGWVKDMIEIYCDESRPETLFSNNSRDRYMVIGGVWLEKSARKQVKNKINYLRKIHGIYGEIKWTKISPMSVEFYKDLVNYFFENTSIRFRCIVVDSTKVDLEKYHKSDSELGFYKFYYQLLVKWIEGNQNYLIYVDEKSNSDGTRLNELCRILNVGGLGTIENVWPINSKESVFVELADVLIGAVSNKYNSQGNSRAKLDIIDLIEDYIGGPISGTAQGEKKFNVFKIILRDV